VVSRCANPSCQARFKYLYEGRSFQFPSLGKPAGLGQSRLNFTFWRLCPRCALSIKSVFESTANYSWITGSIELVVSYIQLSRLKQGSQDAYATEKGRMMQNATKLLHFLIPPA
jgi:hypothetical protein